MFLTYNKVVHFFYKKYNLWFHYTITICVLLKTIYFLKIVYNYKTIFIFNKT